MKKITALIAVITLAGYFTPVQAGMLSDAQLEAVTAGQPVDTNIDDVVDVTNSALASQRNIAAIGSTNGAVNTAFISNTNSATVTGLGDSAVALQTNIAAISSSGAAAGNEVMNSNTASVDNVVGTPASVVAQSASGTESGADINSLLTDVDASASAVATQANVAAIVSIEGDASGNSIDNINDASNPGVINMGDSAVALQSNIGAIAGLGTTLSSDNNMITNTNTATVDNTVVEAVAATIIGHESSTESDAGLNSILGDITASTSAVASQSNIGVVIGAAGVNGATIMNSNSATVNNFGL